MLSIAINLLKTYSSCDDLDRVSGILSEYDIDTVKIDQAAEFLEQGDKTASDSLVNEVLSDSKILHKFISQMEGLIQKILDCNSKALKETSVSLQRIQKELDSIVNELN